MGLKVKHNTILTGLQNREASTNKRTRAELRKSAAQLLELVRRQAPVDLGNLDQAIRSKELRGGMNNRITIQLFVNEEVEIPERPGKTIGDYAVWTHWGDYNLGPRSAEKQAANPDITVGPRYMERAVEAMGDDIVKAIRRAAGLR